MDSKPAVRGILPQNPQNPYPFGEHVQGGDSWAVKSVEEGLAKGEKWAEKYEGRLPGMGAGAGADDGEPEGVRTARAAYAENDRKIQGVLDTVAEYIQKAPHKSMTLGVVKTGRGRATTISFYYSEGKYVIGPLGAEFGDWASGPEVQNAWWVVNDYRKQDLKWANNKLTRLLEPVRPDGDLVLRQNKLYKAQTRETTKWEAGKKYKPLSDERQMAEALGFKLGEWTPLAKWGGASGDTLYYSVRATALPEMAQYADFWHGTEYGYKEMANLAGHPIVFLTAITKERLDKGTHPLDVDHYNIHLPEKESASDPFSHMPSGMLEPRAKDHYYQLEYLHPAVQKRIDEKADGERRAKEEAERVAREAEEHRKSLQSSIGRKPDHTAIVDLYLFKQTMAAVSVSAARETSRPVLTCVKLDFDGHKITMAGANGFTLYVGEVPAAGDTPWSTLVNVKLGKRETSSRGEKSSGVDYENWEDYAKGSKVKPGTLGEVGPTLVKIWEEDGTEAVEVSSGRYGGKSTEYKPTGKKITQTTDGLWVHGKSIMGVGGTYPRYEQLLPDRAEMVWAFSAPKEDWDEAVSRVSKLKPWEQSQSDILQMVCTDNKLLLSFGYELGKMKKIPTPKYRWSDKDREDKWAKFKATDTEARLQREKLQAEWGTEGARQNHRVIQGHSTGATDTTPGMVALNLGYVEQALKTYMKGDMVTIGSSSPSSPVRMDGGLLRDRVIMPMFVQWGDEKPIDWAKISREAAGMKPNPTGRRCIGCGNKVRGPASVGYCSGCGAYNE